MRLSNASESSDPRKASSRARARIALVDTGYRLPHERQRSGPAAQIPYRRDQHGGLDVDDAISESLAAARAPVVDFIRVQHDALSGGAHMRHAPVVEDLDAGVRHTDGVGVMAMLVVGPAGEPCAE
jgi:hypothetical protein